MATCTGSACANGGYERDYTYTPQGKPARMDIKVNSADYYSWPHYDALSGKLSDVRHFSGYTTYNVYASNGTGYLSQITDSNQFPIWQAETRDAELHLTAFTMGGGIFQEQQGFDPNTGRMTSVEATNDNQGDGLIAGLSYQWNHIGNLEYRQDSNAGSGGMTEHFCYDALSRLTDYAYGGTTCSAGTHTQVYYDAIGNITEKTDLCNTPNCYIYNHTAHAVSSITPCSSCSVDGMANGVTANFLYDADGNMLCVTSALGCSPTAARAMTNALPTSFNRESSVIQGATTLSYAYDPEHNRITQTAPEGTTTYLSYPEAGVMDEVFQGGSSTTWRTYMGGDDKMTALRIVTGNQVSMRYMALDNLGSVVAITDEGGNVVNRYAYDPWGESRSPTDWSTDPNICAEAPQPPFVRGFTGQEHLPDHICLINFNARMYDQQIGRFISADPTVEAPDDLQDFNRYSYVGNNPLAFTDPSGLCFLGCFWHSPTFRELGSIAVAAILQQEWALPALAGDIGLTGAAQTIAAAGLSGGISGYVSTGKLHGAFLGAAESLAFFKVGDALGDAKLSGAEGAATKFIAHGMVGGLFTVAGGGRFGSGFLAAGFGTLADNVSFNQGDNEWMPETISHAIAGGVGSALGGGKFANGAMTGAFGYLFNCSLHPGTCTKQEISDEARSCNGSQQCYRDVINNAEEAGLPIGPDMGRVIGEFHENTIGMAAAGASWDVGAEIVGPILGDLIGPAGPIFGRATRGGSSIFDINANDALRIGWGWKGSATQGSDVFRISAEWLRALGVQSGHIDLLTLPSRRLIP
jgi:RHS repeat-associated protein